MLLQCATVYPMGPICDTQCKFAMSTIASSVIAEYYPEKSFLRDVLMLKSLSVMLLLILAATLGFLMFHGDDAMPDRLKGEWTTGCLGDGKLGKEFVMRFEENRYHSVANLYDNNQCTGAPLSQIKGSAYIESIGGKVTTCEGQEADEAMLYWDELGDAKAFVYYINEQGELLTGRPNEDKSAKAHWCLDKDAKFHRR